MTDQPIKPKRSGRRRTKQNDQPSVSHKHIPARASGLAPLTDQQCQMIHQQAVIILADIGLSDAPVEVVDLLIPHGASMGDDGRLRIPPSIIEQVMADLPQQFTLHGRHPDADIHLGGDHVYTGSGGASPQILEYDDGRASYRASTLADLYDAARLVDYLPHIHFFARSLVATDMPDAHSLDINTAYACFQGTVKPVLTSASSALAANDIITMATHIAGSAEALQNQPFFGFNINHAVPPLRYDAASCQVIIRAVSAGVPVMINTFGQLGASSPVTMAGCLAQTMAETLAGMAIAWAVSPDAKAVFGPRPMITDLRTGGMSGGSGEQALLTAAAGQMARFYQWPSSTIAGATDSKTLDAQSGYEKAINVSTAVEAGVNLITQAAGAQASLMAASMAAYVLDNDMLGAIIRASQPLEVNDTTLAMDDIRNVAYGEGHFLGQSATLERMNSDFIYPDIADRSGVEEWLANGQPNLITSANIRAKNILQTHPASYISDKADQTIRDHYDIRLNRLS
ncbi:MAG: trimethylamine methyltransferase [Alphaproteobacteria bacterium]|nr:trimethylamine methyltransferase [Alphaproteobacteria bacterium]MDG2466085.1 trimethylamine methyltransferase family protein [Alphaproteobacteria bacterium]